MWISETLSEEYEGSKSYDDRLEDYKTSLGSRPEDPQVDEQDTVTSLLICHRSPLSTRRFRGNDLFRIPIYWSRSSSPSYCRLPGGSTPSNLVRPQRSAYRSAFGCREDKHLPYNFLLGIRPQEERKRCANLSTEQEAQEKVALKQRNGLIKGFDL